MNKIRLVAAVIATLVALSTSQASAVSARPDGEALARAFRAEVERNPALLSDHQATLEFIDGLVGDNGNSNCIDICGAALINCLANRHPPETGEVFIAETIWCYVEYILCLVTCIIDDITPAQRIEALSAS